jgi:hypothetical protein
MSTGVKADTCWLHSTRRSSLGRPVSGASAACRARHAFHALWMSDGREGMRLWRCVVRMRSEGRRNVTNVHHKQRRIPGPSRCHDRSLPLPPPNRTRPNPSTPSPRTHPTLEREPFVRHRIASSAVSPQRADAVVDGRPGPGARGCHEYSSRYPKSSGPPRPGASDGTSSSCEAGPRVAGRASVRAWSTWKRAPQSSTPGAARRGAAARPSARCGSRARGGARWRPTLMWESMWRPATRITSTHSKGAGGGC